jgi:ligand-binding sensor protein
LFGQQLCEQQGRYINCEGLSTHWKTDAELLENALPVNREINKGVLSLPRGRSMK